MTTKKDDGRVERVLARPLVQRGELKEPGTPVRLRPDQIERLEPDGYFEPAGGGGRKGDGT